MIEWSSYQKAIFEAYENTKKNIVVGASAGSSKTTTLIECLKRTPPKKKVLFVAFNKSIAEELKTKVPSFVECSTLHSKGLRILLSNFRIKMKLEENKTFKMGLKILDTSEIKPKESIRYLFELQTIWDQLRMKVSKDYVIDIPFICIEKDIEFRDRMLEDIHCIESEWKKRIKKIQMGEFEMDFTDMLYLPNLLVSPEDFPKYDVVFQDECLPYHMPVLCKGNVSYPIGKIVEDKMEVEVLSYNEEKEIQEYKKITNWSVTPNQRPLFKITASEKRYKNPSNFVVCTNNHRIWVKGKGYLTPEEITLGDIIQIETSAHKTHKYKITSKGRDALKSQMSKTNEAYHFEASKAMKGKGFSGIQGGNGKVNKLQKYLSERIGKDWSEEYVIATTQEQKEKHNASNHYKIDLFNSKLNIGIEIDGVSHGMKRKQKEDRKKENILSEFGIQIYRIKRSCLSGHFDEIASKINNEDFDFTYIDCPKEVQVRSIEPMRIKEDWVYDISVEDNHNFYANGILVHNCQDLNFLQRNLVLSMISNRGRLISVGDKKQSIYSFMSADLDVYDSIVERPNTLNLPLSISYRCSKAVVREAQKVFLEGIEAWSEAKEGSVLPGELDTAEIGDFVLCRNNKPLVEAFIYLLKLKKPAVIKGKDIGENLLLILDKVSEPKDLDSLLEQKLADLQQKGIPPHIAVNTDTYIALEEKVMILKVLFKEWTTIEELTSQMGKIFSEDVKGKVVLSTIHKSKGLEADNVYFLNQELIPSERAKTEKAKYAEECLRFVAITRAKQNLIYCNI